MWPAATAARAAATLEPRPTSANRRARSCFSPATALEAALRSAAAPDSARLRAMPFSAGRRAATLDSSVSCGPVLATQLAAGATFGTARALLNPAALGAALQGSAAALGATLQGSAAALGATLQGSAPAFGPAC